MSNPNSEPLMLICSIHGSPAESLIAEDAFGREWADLHARCPWSTPFQSPEFARAWYQAYRSCSDPVLVISRDRGGRLMAVLPLAVGRSDRRLVVAGAHQAEYQSWICLPELADTFPPAALKLIRERFPQGGLNFRYLPGGVPLDWLDDRQTRRTCLLQPVRRPLLKLGDGREIRESLNKSGNKSRLRRLKKLGPVRFERVTDRAQFPALLDDLILHYDLRQAGIHGSAPFAEDGLKRPFHLAMLNTPGLLHVTVLRAGREIASVHLNVCRGKELQLYLISHNPLLARFSPGKLHILMLAKMLQEEGFEQVDLTAGGDAYKERFANAGDQVFTLGVYPTAFERLQGSVKRSGERLARRVMSTCDITPTRARQACAALTHLGSLGALTAITGTSLQWLASSTQVRVYAGRSQAARLIEQDASPLVRRNAMEDLLAHQPPGGAAARQAFLADAMHRFEHDQCVFTQVEGGRLARHAWATTDPAAARVAEQFSGLEIPAGTAMVLDYRPRGEIGDPRRRTGFLASLIRSLASGADTRFVYVVVPVRDSAVRGLLERAGFWHEATCFRVTRLGRSRRRVEFPPGQNPGAREQPVAGVRAAG